MSRFVAALAAMLLAACGVETAGTAATGAAVKKQELDAAKRTQQNAQKKIDDATKSMQDSAQKRGAD